MNKQELEQLAIDADEKRQRAAGLGMLNIMGLTPLQRAQLDLEHKQAIADANNAEAALKEAVEHNAA